MPNQRSIVARCEQLLVRQSDERWLKAPNYRSELQLVIALINDNKNGLGKDRWKLVARLTRALQATPEPDPFTQPIPPAKEYPE